MATQTNTVLSGDAASVAPPPAPASKPAAAATESTTAAPVDKAPPKGETKHDAGASLDAAVKALNQSPQIAERNLEFSIDKESGKVVVKIVDRKTGEVIRQIPSKETLALAQDLKKGAAHLFSAKA